MSATENKPERRSSAGIAMRAAAGFGSVASFLFGILSLIAAAGLFWLLWEFVDAALKG